LTAKRIKLKRTILHGFVIGLCLFFINATETVVLTPEELSEDLDQTQRELEERAAYLKAVHADYESVILSIRKKGTKGMTVDEFGLELTKVISTLQDGHAKIFGYNLPEGSLPIQIEPIKNRYIAFYPDHSDFVDPSFPFITKIDGRTIEEWGRVLKPIIQKGSPQFVEFRTLKMLSYIRLARSMAGDAHKNTVTIELESRDGMEKKTVTLDVSDKKLEVKLWPETESHLMEGNIGYLRITGWLEEGLEEVKTWMPQFQNTEGLIIDIRDNPGGTRNVLRELYPYFVKESDKPRVANVAKYRLFKEFERETMDSRHMFPQNWDGWNTAEQEAISDFVQKFTPEWIVPQEEFSEWHFWVLSKRSNRDAYYYPKPVVFLMNNKCFSASDVILSAVKGMPNITLIGASSGGGSGAAIITTLKNSKLELRLSSMASFQSSGKLFEGNGVDPDIAMEPEPEFFIKGGPDMVLKKGIQIITGR